MQFAFVTVYPLCCTYRCINYFSSELFADLSFFKYQFELDCYRSHNTGSLYVYQFNPIEKSKIEDKDICLRSVCAKIFIFKLKLAFAFCTHKLRMPEVGVVTVEFQLQ